MSKIHAYNRTRNITMSLAFIMMSEAGFAQHGFVPLCPEPSFPTPPANGLGIDAQCGIGGSGTGAEATQNKAKNNFCAAGTAAPITIDEMKSLQNKVQQNKKINFGNPREHPLSATPGPVTSRAPLIALGEGKLRTLEGFIMIARQEGGEGVNCGNNVVNHPLFHDIHISIVGAKEDIHGDECDSVVVEMSPHHRPEVWNKSNLLKVAGRHAQVRVTGQLFFDSSHSPCQDGASVSGDPKRASLWEIHPIYKLDVCDAADCSAAEKWLSLDEWLKELCRSVKMAASMEISPVA